MTRRSLVSVLSARYPSIQFTALASIADTTPNMLSAVRADISKGSAVSVPADPGADARLRPHEGHLRDDGHAHEVSFFGFDHATIEDQSRLE